MTAPPATRPRCSSQKGARSRFRAIFLGVLALALLGGCATSWIGPWERVATEADPRLRSAGLLRASGADTALPVTGGRERERLVAHFDAVLEILEAQTPSSVALALARLELARGPLSDFDRRVLAERLGAERARNLAVLRGYRDRGLFPVNEERIDRAVPIFVDARDTACAVGFLMRESGWEAGVAEIASGNNQVFVEDVRGGTLLDWVAASGLTREEAALIQPAYSPPPARTTVAELIASGGPFVTPELIFSDFGFEATLEGPNGAAPAPASLVEASNFGITDDIVTSGTGLFVGASQQRGIGGLVTTAAPFGEADERLSITLSYTVEPSAMGMGIDTASLATYNGFIAGGNLSDGDLVLESRIFASNELVATLVADEYTNYALYDFPSASFPARAALRVETEAVLTGPAYFTYYIHEFEITQVPEPATALLLGLGLSLLTDGARRGVRSRAERKPALPPRWGQISGSSNSGSQQD